MLGVQRVTSTQAETLQHLECDKCHRQLGVRRIIKKTGEYRDSYNDWNYCPFCGEKLRDDV